MSQIREDKMGKTRSSDDGDKKPIQHVGGEDWKETLWEI
jgi:hypothetical protein